MHFPLKEPVSAFLFCKGEPQFPTYLPYPLDPSPRRVQNAPPLEKALTVPGLNEGCNYSQFSLLLGLPGINHQVFFTFGCQEKFPLPSGTAFSHNPLVGMPRRRRSELGIPYKIQLNEWRPHLALDCEGFLHICTGIITSTLVRNGSLNSQQSHIRSPSMSILPDANRIMF